MNNQYMLCAYKEAIKAYKDNEIPVGAVIVYKDKIIAKGKNNRQKKHNVLGHAEINVILTAEKKLKDWRLDNCDLYVTLEPCKMCKSIIKECRIKNVYYLSKQFHDDNDNLFIQTNDCVKIQKEYEKILKNFFQKLRD